VNIYTQYKSDIMDYKCQVLYCKNTALYARNATDDPEFCLEHTHNNYINIYEKSRLCTKPKCHRDAWYAISILDSPIFCKKHALPGYKYVRYKFCLEPKCILHAHYGTSDDANPIWCYQHKKDNHFYYDNIICQGFNCQPETNTLSVQEPVAEQSIQMLTQNGSHEGKFDLKICATTNCMILANYGHIGCSKQMCELHKTPDMIYDPQNKYKTNRDSTFKVDIQTGSHCKSKTLASIVKRKLFRQ
jgi:hypothetical protein